MCFVIVGGVVLVAFVAVHRAARDQVDLVDSPEQMVRWSEVTAQQARW
jgi:hypothetical protein